MTFTRPGKLPAASALITLIRFGGSSLKSQSRSTVTCCFETESDLLNMYKLDELMVEPDEVMIESGDEMVETDEYMMQRTRPLGTT